MNRGFWATFVELCSKINSCSDPQVTKHFSSKLHYNFLDEWKSFVKDKVDYWKNLFGRQLSSVTKNNFNFNFEDKTVETVKTVENKESEESKKNDKENKPQNANDFFNNAGSNSVSHFVYFQRILIG